MSTTSRGFTDSRDFCTGHDSGLMIWDTEDRYLDLMGIVSERNKDCLISLHLHTRIFLVNYDKQVWTALSNPANADPTGQKLALR